MENVTPAAFASTWEASMSEWGTQIQGAVEGLSEALAVGLGLDKDTFTEAAKYGSHLLAPTSTDLQKYGRVGESESWALSLRAQCFLLTTPPPSQSLPASTPI